MVHPKNQGLSVALPSLSLPPPPSSTQPSPGGVVGDSAGKAKAGWGGARVKKKAKAGVGGVEAVAVAGARGGDRSGGEVKNDGSAGAGAGVGAVVGAGAGAVVGAGIGAGGKKSEGSKAKPKALLGKAEKERGDGAGKGGGERGEGTLASLGEWARFRSIVLAISSQACDGSDTHGRHVQQILRIF